MKKSSKTIAFFVVVILAIVVGTAVVALNGKPKDTQTSTSANSQQANTGTKSATEKQFEGYKGEEYDRKFLAGMIVHHQGAIDMAKLALANAKHDELKTLANNIIRTQSSEMTEMTNWQSSWGYSAASGAAMTDHSAMSMQSDMTAMTTALQGKSGDEFDKLFILLMTKHHQSAIDMARPAATNASHQQVKDLATAIISAQSKEINQMEQWLLAWGYTDASKPESGSNTQMNM